MRSDSIRGSVVWRLPLLVWQSLFFVGPLLFMVAMSFFVVKNYRMEAAFDLAAWQRVVGRPLFWDTYFYTARVAATATVAAGLIAFPAAWFLAFEVREKVRRIALFVLIVPFFTSYLVRIFAWQFILAREGVINAALAPLGLGPYTFLNSEFGTLVGFLTLSLPLVVVLQTFALAGIDRRLLEAAHNLGCGPFRSIFAVVLPLARTGLVVAAVFAFILSFGDFVAPYYLGGSKPPTLSIMIVDTTKSGQQWPRAAVVALVMIATLVSIAFAAVGWAYRRR